jgi:serine/threonine protein kinase
MKPTIIGEGSVSVVSAENGVAIKRYKDIERRYKDFCVEVDCLVRMKYCPFVVQIIMDNQYLGTIEMEQLEGNIFHLYDKIHLYPKEKWIEQFLYDVLQADYAMQKKKVLHGDINTNNVLYYITEDNSVRFKVCDFSHSIMIDKHVGVTTPYPNNGAPEWFKQNYGPIDYSRTSTWTIAMMFYSIHQTQTLSIVLCKGSKYYNPAFQVFDDDHIDMLTNFITDNVDGEFKQADLDEMVDILDLNFSKNLHRLRSFLLKALVIDNTKRITIKDSLKMLSLPTF